MKTESHIEFLSRSIQSKFIPKSFQLKANLPGDQNANQQRLNKVSFETINDEKIKHENVLKAAKTQFEISKNKLNEVFDMCLTKCFCQMKEGSH